MRIGFIGAGSMASALARGLGEPALVYDVDEARAEALAAEIGGTAVGSNRELAEGSDLVILAHKPAHTEEAAEQTGGAAKAIASIVGTVPTTRLEAAYPGVPVYRFIPNIPVEVGRGVLCYAPGALAAEGPEEDVLKLFGRAGAIVPLPEEQIDPAMAIMSCGPAFVALVVDAMASAGARHGIEPGHGHPAGDRDDGRHRGLPRRQRARPQGADGPRRHARGRDREGPEGARGHRPARLLRRRRRSGRGVVAMILSAITRADVADYVYTLALVYVVLIFVQVIVSFIPRIPYNRFLSAFLGFVGDVVNPYLNLWRRILPTVRIGPGALDLSPMVGTFVLLIVAGIVGEPHPRVDVAAARAGPGRWRTMAVVARAWTRGPSSSPIRA